MRWSSRFHELCQRESITVERRYFRRRRQISHSVQLAHVEIGPVCATRTLFDRGWLLGPNRTRRPLMARCTVSRAILVNLPTQFTCELYKGMILLLYAPLASFLLSFFSSSSPSFILPTTSDTPPRPHSLCSVFFLPTTPRATALSFYTQLLYQRASPAGCPVSTHPTRLLPLSCPITWAILAHLAHPHIAAPTPGGIIHTPAHTHRTTKTIW